MTPRLLLTALLLTVGFAPVVAGAAPRACGDIGVTVLDSRFTSGIGSDHRPLDDLRWLSPAQARLFLHLTTKGAATLTFRWRGDGRALGETRLQTGPRRWYAWSSLRLPAKRPAEVVVEVLGPGDCLLLTRSLAASAWGLHPVLDRALAQLERGDATGARIVINQVLEDRDIPARIRRVAARLGDTDVAVAQAATRLARDELFLVEPTLRDVEKRLGRTAADRALRERIALLRAAADRRRATLARDQAPVAIAARHLLAVHKLFAGDFPSAETEARTLLEPALVQAGDQFGVVSWTALPRGYRLVLQDRRTGDSFEVTPD